MLAVVAVFATACGSSGGENGERLASGPAEDSTVAASEVFALGADDPLGAVRLESCADLAARGLCQWVVNTMYNFADENQLAQDGEVSLSYASENLEHGIRTAAWPPPDVIPNNPNRSVNWRYESQGVWTGVETTVYYDAPAGYPLGEQVGFYGDVPYSASNKFTCRKGRYLGCRVVRNEGSKDATVLYEVSNAPVSVVITNRLGADVTREGQPQLTSFVVDTKAGNPTSIASGATGYAGGYRSIAEDARYQASYIVGAADKDLAGARATINAVIDHETGLDKGSTCAVSNPRTIGLQLQCNVTVTGGKSGPVTVEVSLKK